MVPKRSPIRWTARRADSAGHSVHRDGVHRLIPASVSRHRSDAIAIGALVALAIVVFGLPSMLGRPVWPGDDLTQNYPLRVFAGQQIRGGGLPLYDPYIWGGTPLLAGWNAAAAYPLTWLFAVLPGMAAWTVGLVATYVTGSVGLYAFLRAGLRLRPPGSFAGALTFAFGGAMAAQVTHFGLVAGMSWVPLGLLAVARLTAGAGEEGAAPGGTAPPEGAPLETVPLKTAPLEATRRRLALDGRWTALLGLVIGLIILAGEPRAIADGLIVIGLYAAWRVVGLGLARSRRCLPALGFVAGGAILGVALSAVQLLPGLAAIDSSQRAGASLVLFSSGSLPSRWLTLMLVPDLLGGSGTLTQPSFFASYNLTEISGYAGILPLVAAFALLARWLTTGLRARPPQWLAWHAMGVVGLVLALGGNTPLGGFLASLPFYGTQRLQSRNILILDIALAVLLAYWIEQPFARRAAPAPAGGTAEAVPATRPAAGRGWRPGRVRQSWPALTETVIAALPALAMIAIAVGVLAGPGLVDWVAASGGISISVIGRLRPYVAPYLLLGVAAVVLLVAGRKLTRRVLAALATALVVIDVAAFSLLTVVEVDARPQPAPPAASAPAVPSPGDASSGDGPPAAGASVPRLSARPVSALGYPGRFVIFDPDLHDTGDLSALQPPDTNSITGTPSVQGYSSIVDGRYATATGSHMATGEGQDTLAPAAVSDGTLDDLDTTLLLTLPEYADGALRSELTAPHWMLKGWDGGFEIFANTKAKAPLTLAAAPGQTTAGASVSDVTGPAATDPTRAVVRSSAGVTVVRSVAAIAGWSASWQPAKGPSVALPVRARGVVQAVTVPAGTGVLTWSYTSPKLDQGLALSVAAAAAILALLLYPLARRRRGEPAPPPVQPDAVAAESAAR